MCKGGLRYGNESLYTLRPRYTVRNSLSDSVLGRGTYSCGLAWLKGK